LAAAQDLTKVELFGGYSILIFASKDISTLQARVASTYGPLMNAYPNKFFKNGATISAVYNINDNWGAECNTVYHSGNILRADGFMSGVRTNSNLKVTDFAAFFGPRYAVRTNEKVTPFVHALVGINRFRLQPALTVGGDFQTYRMGVPFTRDLGLAVKVGGGLDFRVKDYLAIRAIQADFVWNKNSLPTTPKTDLSLKNASFSAGVVFHLLAKK